MHLHYFFSNQLYSLHSSNYDAAHSDHDGGSYGARPGLAAPLPKTDKTQDFVTGALNPVEGQKIVHVTHTLFEKVPTSDQMRVTPAGRSTLTRHTLGDEAEEVKPDEKGVPEIEKVVKKFKKRGPVEKKLTHLTNSEELSKSSEKLNMKEENRNRA